MEARNVERVLREGFARAEQQFKEKQNEALENFLSQQRMTFESMASTLHSSRTSFLAAELDDTIDVAKTPGESLSPRESTPLVGQDTVDDSAQLSSSQQGDMFFRMSHAAADFVRKSAIQPIADTLKIDYEVSKTRDAIKPRNWVQEALLPIVHSHLWEIFSIMLVLSMGFCLGMDVHCEERDLIRQRSRVDDDCISCDENLCWWIPDWKMANVSLFTFEMLMRMFAEQVDFYRGPHRYWNSFDSALLLVSASDMCFPHSTLMGMMRVTRFFRMLRIFEIFPDLRTMIYSFFACSGSLGWAIFLLTTLAYMFAIYLIEVTIQFLRYSDASDSNVEDETLDLIKAHWYGIGHSMMSLAYAVTGGTDWKSLVAVFFSIHVFHGVVFTLSILLTMIGMLNILVGVFAQKANDLSGISRDVALATASIKLRQNTNAIIDLFNEFDKDGSGNVNLKEIEKAMDNPRIAAWFRHLEIDFAHPEVMLHFLDRNGNGKVNESEFIAGCERLQGYAKPAEVAEILILCKALMDILRGKNGTNIALEAAEPQFVRRLASITNRDVT